jgi:hypothetical protein
MKRCIGAAVAGLIVGVLLMWTIGTASAATTVNIPFPPREKPIWIPKYMERADSWPVSLIFAPFVVVMSAIATTVEEPFGTTHSSNLRKTAAAMVIHGVHGKRKFQASRSEVATSCTVRGNWVNAPCN